MARAACLAAAGSLALLGAQCFVVPSAPRVALETGAEVAQQAAAFAASPEQPRASAWSPLAIGAALGLLVAVAGGRPAVAADLENGENVFLANCASCHAGGNNTIYPEKKLKKDAIEKYLTGGYNVDAIKYQVTNGKGSMPAFGERLGPDDIDDVASYVFGQATKW